MNAVSVLAFVSFVAEIFISFVGQVLIPFVCQAWVEHVRRDVIRTFTVNFVAVHHHCEGVVGLI